MFYLGITDCARAVYFPYGVLDVKQGVNIYSQFVLLELPDSDSIKIRFNSDILKGWTFSPDNNVTTENVKVGADTFILATVGTPVAFLDDGKYYVKMYNKRLTPAPAYNYDPAKDATIPVIEYEIGRG